VVANVDQLPSVPGAVSGAVSRYNLSVILVSSGINDVLDAYESASCKSGGGTLYFAYRAILSAMKAAAPLSSSGFPMWEALPPTRRHRPRCAPR